MRLWNHRKPFNIRLVKNESVLFNLKFSNNKLKEKMVDEIAVLL